MEITTTLGMLRRQLNAWALPLGIAGCGLLALRTWRQWQRDQNTFHAKNQPVQVPQFEHWPTLPKVSILVAAWNEAPHIQRHIKSFLALSYPYKELILCAGGTDATYELALPYTNDQIVVLEQQSGEGKQRALRRCLAHSDGNIIFLTDSDCVIDDQSFVHAIEPIVQGCFEVVTGRSEPLEEQRHSPFVQYQWFIDLEWSQRLPETVDGVLGRNCAISRVTLEQIGNFDAPARTGTDYVMSRRLVEAGIPIRSQVDSLVSTEYPPDATSYLRMWRRWNKNLLIHGLHFRAWNDVRGVAVAATLYAGMGLLLVLSPLVGPIALVAVLLLFATAGLNRLRKVAGGARLAQASLTPRLALQVFASTALDMVAVLLAVHDALRPRHRARW